MFEKLQSTYGQVKEKILSWMENIIVMLPNLLLAILIIVATVIVSKFFRKLTKRTLSRFIHNKAIVDLLGSVTYIIIVTIGFFVALRVLDLDKTVTSLLAGVGIVGLALGFAFKDIAANFIAGIYMAVKSPINVGDVVEYHDVYGVVKKIGLRAITIESFQGQNIIIPNRLIMEEKYKHYTINKERRIDLDVGISYGDDLDKVERVTLESIKKIDYLLKDKPVDLYFTEFADSAITFTVRYWVRYTPRDILVYLRAVSDGIKNIKKAYEENDITITFPIRTIDFGIKGGESLADMINKTN
ncbi:MAG: mechanosensitive ion channel family protein [Bacteroidetes bacterium]|nr:mechanosensitive ion channel family protein [Bacteroidota bacterium]